MPGGFDAKAWIHKNYRRTRGKLGKYGENQKIDNGYYVSRYQQYVNRAPVKCKGTVNGCWRVFGDKWFLCILGSLGEFYDFLKTLQNFTKLFLKIFFIISPFFSGYYYRLSCVFGVYDLPNLIKWVLKLKIWKFRKKNLILKFILYRIFSKKF